MKIDRNLQYNEYTVLKALEDLEPEKAVQVFDEHPDLDQETISRLMDAHFMNRVIEKDTKEPLKLNDKTVMAILRNRVNFLEIEHKKKIKNKNGST